MNHPFYFQSQITLKCVLIACLKYLCFVCCLRFLGGCDCISLYLCLRRNRLAYSYYSTLEIYIVPRECKHFSFAYTCFIHECKNKVPVRIIHTANKFFEFFMFPEIFSSSSLLLFLTDLCSLELFYMDYTLSDPTVQHSLNNVKACSLHD